MTQILAENWDVLLQIALLLYGGERLQKLGALILAGRRKDKPLTIGTALERHIPSPDGPGKKPSSKGEKLRTFVKLAARSLIPFAGRFR
jgi:hypothetical protein